MNHFLRLFDVIIYGNQFMILIERAVRMVSDMHKCVIHYVY